jgi:hypothetical protein
VGDAWWIAFFRAAGLLAGLSLLYPPLAWFERWCNLPPGEREKIGHRALLPFFWLASTSEK